MTAIGVAHSEAKRLAVPHLRDEDSRKLCHRAVGIRLCRIVNNWRISMNELQLLDVETVSGGFSLEDPPIDSPNAAYAEILRMLQQKDFFSRLRVV